jgi:hypothetical protein
MNQLRNQKGAESLIKGKLWQIEEEKVSKQSEFP